MAVREDVMVGQEVRERLGEALGSVLASLWTVDCQSCNRPLTGRQPALSVDDMMTFASASLHHSKCRPSRWNDDVLVSASPHPTLSHHTACVLVPVVIAEANEPVLKPFLLVNPGLEQVFLAAARWVSGRSSPTERSATPG